MQHWLSSRTVLLAIALASGIGLAPGAAADRAAGSLEIAFTATSTLHDFEGTAPPVPVVVEQGPDGSWSSEVSVPVAGLDTGIRRRDQSLRAMLDADHHPQIRARFPAIDPEQVRRRGVLPFQLRIRDVERPIEAKVSHWQQDDRRAQLDAEFDVSLAAFGLEAPSVLFVSVGDTVHVTVHVKLERS